MKNLLSALVAVMAFSFATFDAEAAKRIGGGRSVGTQRDVSPQQAAPKAPAQQQQQAAAPAAPTPQAQPSGMSKWLGPLAGLALGAGLAALFMNNGMAGALAGLLMIAAIIAVAVFAFRMLRGRPAGAPAEYAGAGAGAGGPSPSVNVPRAAFQPGTAAPGSLAATLGGQQPAASRWPAGFDADAFVRQAKLNFVRLQDAHSARDVSTLRDFLTPELYREIERDLAAEFGPAQKLEVVTLAADVTDVVEEAGQYIVSVGFSGMIREGTDEAPQAFSETWHLQKPVSGASGWLLAGIQQN